jgi:hypothetical protein
MSCLASFFVLVSLSLILLRVALSFLLSCLSCFACLVLFCLIFFFSCLNKPFHKQAKLRGCSLLGETVAVVLFSCGHLDMFLPATFVFKTTCPPVPCFLSLLGLKRYEEEREKNSNRHSFDWYFDYAHGSVPPLSLHLHFTCHPCRLFTCPQMSHGRF